MELYVNSLDFVLITMGAHAFCQPLFPLWNFLLLLSFVFHMSGGTLLVDNLIMLLLEEKY
jgi:hypothetical protein